MREVKSENDIRLPEDIIKGQEKLHNYELLPLNQRSNSFLIVLYNYLLIKKKFHYYGGLRDKNHFRSSTNLKHDKLKFLKDK